MIKREILANYSREDKELREKRKLARRLDKNKRLQRNLIKAYKRGEDYYKFSMSGGNSVLADFYVFLYKFRCLQRKKFDYFCLMQL